MKKYILFVLRWIGFRFAWLFYYIGVFFIDVFFLVRVILKNLKNKI